MAKVNVREVIGFLGVTASLVFVGLEVRQNTIATRATAYQDMGAAVSGFWLDVASDSVRAKSTIGPLVDAELSGTDAQQLSQLIATYRQYEVIWRQVGLGLLEDEALYYFGWDPSQFMELGGWDLVRRFMSEDFAVYVETAAASP